MTCREKLKLEHPTLVSSMFVGGCKGCPSEYGYLTGHHAEICRAHSNCVECWDQELQKTVETGIDTAEPIVKDSGERRQFESGAVRDIQEGKGRCDLMPLEVVSIITGQPILVKLKWFLYSLDTTYLYTCLRDFVEVYDRGEGERSTKYISDIRLCTMFLEVAKHFEDGAKKYGENNWQKGIPVNCYVDSAVRHYLKWLRGDRDEPHDRAFVWNLMCCIWEVDYHNEKLEGENG